MAALGLLALLDDISVILDDIAILTKVATKKTAGVLGDDLALNAQQMVGIRAERELPIVWAVAKGSAKNKLLLVPAALAISALAPSLVIVLLMLGGSYLCYEGFEKVVHLLEKHWSGVKEDPVQRAAKELAVDPANYEKQKIKAAVRTDFILSAEIVIIVLGVVQEASLVQQVLVVSLIAAMITIGVYGLVAMIVKLDDVGLYFIRENTNRLLFSFGQLLLWFCPWLMKSLAIVGTVAMFLVGGGILAHGILELLGGGAVFEVLVAIEHSMPELLFNGASGIAAGAVLLVLVRSASLLRNSLVSN